MAIPSDGHPSWAKRARPVLRFLSTPRTWKEIREWQKQVKMSDNIFTNTLAWAENRHLVRSFDREGVLHWHCPHKLPAATTEETHEVSDEEDAEDECHDGRGGNGKRRASVEHKQDHARQG